MHKPGDKVFWVCEDVFEQTEYQLSEVISLEDARTLYCKLHKDEGIVNRTKQIIEENPELTVTWIIDLGDTEGKSVGWMPSTELHPLTEAAKVLYGIKETTKAESKIRKFINFMLDK